MKPSPNLLLLFPVLGLSACATSGSPLIFGEAVNFGVTANVGADSQGFDFTLGYKDKNLAIVPVAIVTDDKVSRIQSYHTKCTKRHDALSVFGQFTSQGNWPMLSTEPEKRGAIKLDRFFATGLAAANLADGYRKGMQAEPCTPKAGSTSCADKDASEKDCEKDNTRDNTRLAATSSAAPTTAGPATSAKAPAASAPDAGPPASEPERKVIRMYFGQSNTIGIGISVQTAVAEQGPSFTLGYSGRSIAYIPTQAPSKGGKARLINGGGSEDNNDNAEKDALSVFGQFKAQTGTNSIDFGLGRFFSTGLAARNLADGFGSLATRQIRDEIADQNEKRVAAKAGAPARPDKANEAAAGNKRE